MTPSRSSMLTLAAATALLQSHAVAVAGPVGAGFADGAELVAPLISEATESGKVGWQLLLQWVVDSYERAPALMLGLSVLFAVPPLALAGLLVRRTRPSSPDATVRISRSRKPTTGEPQMTTVRADVSSWPTQAWVELEGIPGERYIIERTLLRIGREEDNDIRFPAPTVHRYHAVIRRTTEGDVVITDLSGDDGNGVLVNGHRVSEAMLQKGDHISVGEVKLRFDSRPV
jgi:FHA domain-containing protein